MKTCFKCARQLPLEEFYKHPMMGDGRLGKCKDCSRADAKVYKSRRIATDPEALRTYARERWRRCGADKNKVRARNALNGKVRYGGLERGPCEHGGDCEGRIEGHHDDYSRPLDVRWLCQKHHALRHRRAG